MIPAHRFFCWKANVNAQLRVTHDFWVTTWCRKFFVIKQSDLWGYKRTFRTLNGWKSSVWALIWKFWTNYKDWRARKTIVMCLEFQFPIWPCSAEWINQGLESRNPVYSAAEPFWNRYQVSGKGFLVWNVQLPQPCVSQIIWLINKNATVSCCKTSARDSKRTFNYYRILASCKALYQTRKKRNGMKGQNTLIFLSSSSDLGIASLTLYIMPILHIIL
jgi:hypothetical protein